MRQTIANKGITSLRHQRIDGLIRKIDLQLGRLFNIKRGLSILCLILLSYCTSALSTPQSAEVSSQSINVQAALIKNFTHLIEWPKTRLVKDNTEFNLCTYQSKKLEQQFKTIFTNKQIKGKQVNILSINSTDFKGCDLIYITDSSKKLLSRVLESARTLGILTISAQDGYGEQGIHINFYKSGQNMAFELNKHALDSAGFQVSTQLYRYARIVK
ncbi:MAG: hypothetical protein ACJAWS_000847 [Oleiphilaceae bacterium]|jgi:hypothetical protein